MTLWDLHKGDLVTCSEHKGEILTLIEEPHPLLIGAGIEAKFKRPGGKVVFFKDFNAVKDKQQFTKVRGLEDLKPDEIGAMIAESVREAIAPICTRLWRAKKLPTLSPEDAKDMIAIFSGEIISHIPTPAP
jgi:hypothetical protein